MNVSVTSLGSRQAQHERLRGDVYDLLVIGGGITGAGVALDAAARGLRVALVEKSDFGSGTSSRSTKLVHGGLRYLESFQFGLIHESLSERHLLQQLAPTLVEPIPFLFPIYSGLFDLAKIHCGLWLYDLLALLRSPRVHRRLGQRAVLAMAPELRNDGLSGGFVYYDSRTDDVRLTLEVIRTAVGLGSAASNYVEVVGLSKSGGQVVGAEIIDRPSGEAFQITARQVVVACGVWMDDLLKLDDPSWRPRLRPARGVHLLIPQARFGRDFAFILPTSDGRLIFAIPWQGATLVGTTDTDHKVALDDPKATVEEVEYLLAALNRLFPALELSVADVISVQAGLRPLIDTGGASTTGLSREDRIYETDSGLIAIAGGKLTTYRRMARRVVDMAVRRLRGQGQQLPPGKLDCQSGRIGLGIFAPDSSDVSRAMPVTTSLDASTVEHLRRSYGAAWATIAGLAEESPALREPLVPGLPNLKAEVVYSARHELAVTVADVLVRRNHVALLEPGLGRGVAPEVARLMSEELGWSPAEVADHLAEYERQIAQFSPTATLRC